LEYIDLETNVIHDYAFRAKVVAPMTTSIDEKLVLQSFSTLDAVTGIFCVYFVYIW
jgi:hypothetical protein